MTFEEELRAAMHAEVDDIATDDGAWMHVARRARRRRATRAGGISLLAAAAVVGAIVGVNALIDDGPAQRVIVVPPATTPTSVEVPAEDAAFPGIWPFASMSEVDAYEADPGIGMFFDADATALEFARVYLGMPEPTLAEPIGAGVGDTRAVNLTSKPGSPMVTTVLVHPLGDEGAYSVIDANTYNLQLNEPETMRIVGTNVSLTGTSTAFEATVNVEVRQDGQVFGEHLGEGIVMGGSMGEMGPFEGDVTIDPPTQEAGAIILYTLSAEDGSVQEAHVNRVLFDEAQVSEDLMSFSVFFHRDEDLVEVTRAVEPTSSVLRTALDALFAGPTEDEATDGLASLFSDETADLLAGVNLTEDGTAIVDLAGTVNNASTSAGSMAFLDELNATVFQFETVERVEYRLQGSCEDFWSWLQRDGCDLVSRGD